MKKFAQAVFLTFSAIMLLIFLVGCDTAGEMGSLKDISKPYTGMYECENLSIGGRDMTDKFESVTLELKGDGRFEVFYRTTAGREGGYEGEYTLDEERKEITFSSMKGARQKSFTFPYEKGTVCIDYNLMGSLLHAEFRMP